MTIKLPSNLSLPRLLGVLNRVRPVVIGLALVGLFGYAALIIQRATNVTPDSVTPKATISFDRKTITSLKNLTVVSGETPSASLGKSDPFGR